jgi:hypothetical protein
LGRGSRQAGRYGDRGNPSTAAPACSAAAGRPVLLEPAKLNEVLGQLEQAKQSHTGFGQAVQGAATIFGGTDQQSGTALRGSAAELR